MTENHKIIRCDWSGTDPLYIDYHDNEWGVPVHDDTKLFEMLILEGFQAGLSWITILRKRDRFREVFAEWDVSKVAAFTQKDQDELLQDSGIIRNRLKIKSAIGNAREFIKIQSEFASFDKYIWQFTHNKTICRQPRSRNFKELPVFISESEEMSRDLRSRGFRFVGPTICYAFMQAVGIVDDHQLHCFKAVS